MRLQPILMLCMAVTWLGRATAATLGSTDFSIEQILSAAFPSSLIAAPEGNRFAWVSNSAGRRNVWLATSQAAGSDYNSHSLTRNSRDDGQDIGDLAFVPRRNALVFVRGGDFDNPDKPAPNPLHLAAGVEQDLLLVDFNSGVPHRLAEGHAPSVSPSGDRVVFLHKGEIWTVAPRTGAKATQLFKVRGDLDELRFSPDGTKLAFVSNRGDHSFIGVYAFADQSLRWIDPSLGFDFEPRWSPDGTRIAFLRVPSTHAEVEIRPHRIGEPWSIRVATMGSDGPTIEVYRSPRGAGSVFYALSSDSQLLWTPGDRLVFPAESDGWLHLYAVSARGGEAQVLTPGNFEIEYAAASKDGSTIIFAGNMGDIDRRHLWQLTLPSAAMTALTQGQGIETAPVIASDGSTIAFLHSDAKLPMRAAVMKAHESAVDLHAEILPKDFPSSLVTPESVVLPARAGVAAHAQLFLPASTPSAIRHPAVIFLHGGPVRQMLAGWHYRGYYSNAYGFNQYLASRGYVVLALNYRSGIGYGLDYRKAEHSGAAGASEYNDLLAAADYLRGRLDVDATRIGLWGGSYGGYLTALGLARNSDVFSAGVDMHGVHDWYRYSLGRRDGRAYYPPDLPADALATALAASPTDSVSTWRSPVLFIHGDDDHNVDFSETVRLAESLRAHGVVYSDLVFPDEVHDFLRHESWLRAYHAAADFLDRNLLRR
jgi:dipeptidyl aminopeptidase/acylaminoacyl peptidase